MLDIRKERRAEWLFNNGLILGLFLLLYVSFHFGFLEILLMVSLISILIISIINVVKPGFPKPLFKWKRTLRDHEIHFYGYKDWRKRNRIASILLIIVILVIGNFIVSHILTHSDTPLSQAEIKTPFNLQFLLISIAANTGYIVRSKWMDSFYGKNVKGFELKGRTLVVFFGIILFWTLFWLVVFYLF
ncbi:hypothetical protein MM326_05810 [Alkalihalobacillus sp. LMS6]|uniref:hypothetical protein n=1 Tax=Alkalihalobacillus sp. LMS6 TaxID=2924034 RepID=UPI0020D016C0|nr:hypothetical protein [Alkalihalobacillus sp. LMS6]UTR07543.1 hypothetical protein MM326_05810 [Alkalihalobacillus sp. LMS6]